MSEDIDIGAFAEALNDKADVDLGNVHGDVIQIAATSGTVTLESGRNYRMVINGNTTFVLPVNPPAAVFNRILVQASVDGQRSVDWGTLYFYNKTTPAIEAGAYDFIWEYDTNLEKWCAMAVSKGVEE